MNNYHYQLPVLNTSRKRSHRGYPHDLNRIALLFMLCKALKIKKNDPLVKDIWYCRSYYVTSLITKLTAIATRRGISIK